MRTSDTQDCLAIIPARGGSKRIPRKNIKSFDGMPIIAHPIRAALEASIFSEVMVSSDDDQILAIARDYGAVTPFRRLPETSSDTATTADVISEVLTEYKRAGQKFSEACCIYPTAAFVTGQILLDSHRFFSKSGADACISLLSFNCPIQKALRVDDGRVSFIFPECELIRSQDLLPVWHDAGQFYWMRTDAFEREGRVFMKHTVGYHLPQMAAHDIDTLEDWEVAEFKFQYLRQRVSQPR